MCPSCSFSSQQITHMQPFVLLVHVQVVSEVYKLNIYSLMCVQEVSMYETCLTRDSSLERCALLSKTQMKGENIL
jgi:hypothetical protein